MKKQHKDKLDKELTEVKKILKKRKKYSYRKNSSRLDKLREDILYLRQNKEATLSEIQLWLRTRKRIKVERSTILRRINKWIMGER